MAVKRALRYISGTQREGLTFGISQSTEALGFSDSDWGGCKTTRKSTSGYVFMMAGAAISWRSRKQSVTASSSCEAEYVAACTATKEAVWLARLIADMHGSSAPKQIVISADNQGAIDTTRNQAINQRNKHIDIQMHYVRDMLENDSVELVYCPTESMTADTLTKPLDSIKFPRHKSSISVGPMWT